MATTSYVKVAVRMRPLSGKEEHDYCIHTLPQQPSTITPPSSFESYAPEAIGDSCYQTTVRIGKNNFSFQNVFPPSTKQRELYSKCVVPLIHSCLEGYNATVLTYGQALSGKTHTIIGDAERGNFQSGFEDNDRTGIIPRALRDIFLGLEQTKASYNKATKSKVNDTTTYSDERRQDRNEVEPRNQSLKPVVSNSKPPYEYQVKVQFLELYGELLQDLIQTEFDTDSIQTKERKDYSKQSIPGVVKSGKHTDKKKIRLMISDGKADEEAEVLGVCQAHVRSVEEALYYVQRGMENRYMERNSKAASSRSHTIFTVSILQTRRNVTGPVNDYDFNQREDQVEMKISKMHFVDLAGSDKIKSSKTDGKRMQERLSISKGFCVFDNVISALSNNKIINKANTPYRDSKLTRLLKGSLGGNHETLMIACVSPSSTNKDQSLKTLRYAYRAMNIMNYTAINRYSPSRVVDELSTQVSDLATELLRIRRVRYFDNRDYGYPFSMYFLEGLTAGGSSRWKCYQQLSSSSESVQLSIYRPTTAPIRPSSSVSRKSYKYARSLGSLEMRQAEQEEHLRVLQEALEEKTDAKVGNCCNDKDCENELIISYDFVLKALRETMQTIKAVEGDGRELPRKVDMPPGLNMVRTIDELYGYLQSQVFVVKNVEYSLNKTSNHFARLDQSIFDDENIIKEMKKSQEKCKANAIGRERELMRIDSEIENCLKEKEALEGVMELLKEGSRDWFQKFQRVSEIKVELTKYKKERKNIMGMFDVVDKNERKIRSLKRNVITKKRQRLELKREHSKSLVDVELQPNHSSLDLETQSNLSDSGGNMVQVDSKISLSTLEDSNEDSNYDYRFSDRELTSNRDRINTADLIDKSISSNPGPLLASKWAEPDANSFRVRGKRYLSNKKKINAGNSLFRLITVDVIKAEKQFLTGVSLHPGERIQKALEIEKEAKGRGVPSDMPPFVFVMNLSLKGPPAYNLVFYFAVDDISLIDGTTNTSFSKMCKKFFFGDSDEFRDNTFKMIPQIVKGNFIVRNAARSTPVILGKKLKQYYCKGERFCEVTIDTGSNQIANGAIKLCNGFSKTIVVDLAFLLEGSTHSTLPEKILGCVRMKCISLADDSRALGAGTSQL